MTSAFISLATALPTGHDAAASALFMLGKSTLKEPVSIPHELDASAVRSAKRDTVAATVTAVMAGRDPAALAVHQGDSRVSVQRALGENDFTPEKTLVWLLQSAVRRSDKELLENVAHRVSVEALFQTLGSSRGRWAHLSYSKVAKTIVDAGEAWPLRAMQLGHSQLSAAVLGETLNRDLPFEHLLGHSDIGDDRLLAVAATSIGRLTDAMVAHALAGDPRSFVDECWRASRQPAISGAQYALLASVLVDTPKKTVPEMMLNTFSPTESSKDLFLAALKTTTAVHIFEAGTRLLGLCTPEEGYEVLEHIMPHNPYRAVAMYRALPDTALAKSRELVCSHISGSSIRTFLIDDSAAHLTVGELAAMVSSREQAASAANGVFDFRVMRQPWFDDFADMIGSHLLAMVGRHSAANSYVAQRLVDALGDNVEGIVLAAKLINDGFVGSISELINTALVMHPRAEEVPTPALSEGQLEQLELFA
jgi:hypothetical protein